MKCIECHRQLSPGAVYRWERLCSVCSSLDEEQAAARQRDRDFYEEMADHYREIGGEP